MVDNIKLLCSQKGYTLKSLERDCGFGNSTVARWDKNAPAIDKVQRVCAVLGVPLSALVDDPYAIKKAPAVIGESDLSEAETELLSSFRELNEEGQKKLVSYLEDLQAAGIYKRYDSSHVVVGE